MENFGTKTIREIAVENPASTRIFEEYKIDYCCGGGHNFDDACRKAGVSPDVVSMKIDQLLTPDGPESPETMNVLDLLNYILEKHHTFTKQAIARVIPLMEKVCAKHGDHHNELHALQRSLTELCDDLIPHMEKEERVLFPFIRTLYLSDVNSLSVARPPFGTVENPVSMLMMEHDRDGDILKTMRETAGGYIVPDGACPSFRALYAALEELELDLHKHIHLENNVLFPAAIAVEKKCTVG